MYEIFIRYAYFFIFLMGDDNLSLEALHIIETQDEMYLSIASLCEIAIKRSLGKLQIDSIITELETICDDQNIAILPINSKHLQELSNLPFIHRDPFGRLLISQSKEENCTLITRDNVIKE